jgi:hypothetical protein
MKKLLKNYWGKTPKALRKIGDSLLAVALLVIADKASGLNLTSFLSEKEVRYIAIGAVVGKFLTNLFKEEEKKPE